MFTQGKDTTEPRSRGANNNPSRSGKTGADRYLGRGGSTSYNSSGILLNLQCVIEFLNANITLPSSFAESAALPGKSTYKKENGSTPYASSLSSVPALSGNSRSRVSVGLRSVLLYHLVIEILI